MRVRLGERVGKAKLSQKEFAELIGVDQSLISRYENELTTPEDETLKRIAAEEGISLVEFKYGLSPEKGRGGESVYPSLTVSVVAYVVMGDRALPFDTDHSQAIRTPVGVAPDDRLRALRVEDGAIPNMDGGWYILFRQPLKDEPISETCFDGPCLVKTADGDLLIKHILHGPRASLYHLVSYSQTASILRDVRLEWAAPIMAFFPPNMITLADD